MGYPDRYEGALVLLSYLFVFLTITSFVNSEKHAKILSIFVGAFAISIIGVFQYFGYDIFKTNFGKSLILSKEYMVLADQLEFKFDKNAIYATLFHYNYVGSYVSMLFPLCFTILILTRNRKLKIAMTIMSILLGVLVIGSNARSGIVGTSLAIFFIAIILNKIIRRNLKILVASIAALSVIFVGLNTFSNGFIEKRISSLITDVKRVVGLEEKDELGMASIPLKDIEIDSNHAKIITASETLGITYEDNSMKKGISYKVIMSKKITK